MTVRTVPRGRNRPGGRGGGGGEKVNVLLVIGTIVTTDDGREDGVTGRVRLGGGGVSGVGVDVVEVTVKRRFN